MKKAFLIANVGFTITNFRFEFIEELKKRGFLVYILCPTDSDFNDNLTKIDAKVINIPLERKGLNPLKDLSTGLAIYKELKREKPDVVYNYTIKPVIYGSIAAFFANVPNIFSNITGLGHLFTTNNIKTKVIRFILFFLYRFALSKNTKVFFQNSDDRDLFLNNGLVKKEKTKIINGSGINLNRFKPAINLKKDSQSFILIGRLIKEKGVGEFIEAIRIVKKSYPNVKCTLVGDVDDNPTSFTQSEIESWDIAENLISFKGRVDDVRPLLEKTEVCVLPSYREGTPRSVLESMSMGLPIITTDAPGCRETVVNGDNGFLVPIKDPIALSKAMLKFLDKPDLIQSMGEKSLAIAKEKYDVIKVNESILSELQHSTQ